MAFLARQGLPTMARSIHREQAEAFIAAELERTAPSSAATRYRSLQQLVARLDEEGRDRRVADGQGVPAEDPREARPRARG